MVKRVRGILQRRPILILLILLLIGVLAFALNDFVQERIAPPLLSWMWSVYIMSSGFPQVMTWAFFIAAIPVIAIFSLIRGRSNYEEDVIGSEAAEVGQVQTLARWIRQAPDGDYFRMRLIRHLSGLSLDVLAYKERLSTDEVSRAFERGDLQLDSEVDAYLRQGLHKRAYESTSAGTWRGRRWGLRSRSDGQETAPWHDPDMERMIEFLETQLEVARES